MIDVIKKISFGEYAYAGVGPFVELTVDSIYENKILLGDSRLGEYRFEINYSDVDNLIRSLEQLNVYNKQKNRNTEKPLCGNGCSCDTMCMML